MKKLHSLMFLVLIRGSLHLVASAPSARHVWSPAPWAVAKPVPFDRTFFLADLYLQTLPTAAPGPAFEVATVKPADPKAGYVALFTYPGGRITVTGYSVRQLIREAFNVQDFQILGGPAWLDNDKWDIAAKPPSGSRASASNPASRKEPMNPEQREMLQALLIERFNLKFHTTTRDAAVYIMTLSGKNPKLRASTSMENYPSVVMEGGSLRGNKISMAAFATRLGDLLHRAVIDETGLAGDYDFFANYPENNWKTGDRLDDAIFDSLRWLGLKLESGNRRREVLVVDNASKPTSD